jgi:hypothetical protein
MPSIIHCDIAVDEDDCEKLLRIIQGNITTITLSVY